MLIRNGSYHLGGTYHRVTKHEVPVQEFVEPNPSDYFIYWLFKYRCIECRHPATEINEIVPRSRSKKSIMDWKNRVPMCRVCHDRYHNGGVSANKIAKMRYEREVVLKSTGREKYV